MIFLLLDINLKRTVFYSTMIVVEGKCAVSNITCSSKTRKRMILCILQNCSRIYHSHKHLH